MEVKCNTYLVFCASNIGSDGAFLLLGMHFPLPAALVGTHRWAVHGGRSLILWRRESIQTRLDTVTACAPEQERNRSLMYFPYYFRGFRGVCLWWKNVSGLFILPSGVPYIIVLKLLCL